MKCMRDVSEIPHYVWDDKGNSIINGSQVVKIRLVSLFTSHIMAKHKLIFPSASVCRICTLLHSCILTWHSKTYFEMRSRMRLAISLFAFLPLLFFFYCLQKSQ